MDQDAVNLAKSIRQTESGGDFNAKGKSGESGAYQWTPDTWKKNAQDALGDANAPMTPDNQNAVAYVTIKKLKDQGLNPAQIAATWNSGSPDGWENKVGTNSQGVHYDVPQYVKSVTDTYQQYKQGNTNPSVSPNPSTVSGNGFNPKPFSQPSGATPFDFSTTPPPDQTQKSPTQQVEDLAKGAVNFLAPSVGDAYHLIKGDNQKTGLQLAGDLGSTALSVGTLIPGVGEGILGAKAGVGALEGAAKIAPTLAETVGKNAVLGAGFGVSGALGEGKTDAGDVAKSGIIGGATGGLLGGATKLGGDYLAGKAGTTATTRLTDQTNRLKTLGKAFNANSTASTNPIQTLEQTGLIKELKTPGGKIDVTALTNPQDTGKIDNLIEDHSTQATELVKGMKGAVPLEEFKNEILKSVGENPLIRDAGELDKAEAEVNRRFASYQRSFGDNLPYTVIDNIRAAMNRVYDPAERDVARTIGDAARSSLYNGDGANTALKTAMANEAELIKTKNFLEKLHGTTVPGGQLGKYFADLAGATVGSTAGSFLGPLGNIGGGILGGATTNAAMNLAHRNYFNPIGSRAAGFLQNALQSKGGQVVTGGAKAGLLRAASGI